MLIILLFVPDFFTYIIGINMAGSGREKFIFFQILYSRYYEFKAENSHHGFQGEQPGWGGKVDHKTEISNHICQEQVHCEECTGWLGHPIHGLWPLRIFSIQLCGIQSLFHTFPGYFCRVIFPVNIIHLSKVQGIEDKNHLPNGYFRWEITSSPISCILCFSHDHWLKPAYILIIHA